MNNDSTIKKEYLKLVRKLKKQIKSTPDCKEKEQFLLAIDTYIKTIKSDEITEEELLEYLKTKIIPDEMKGMKRNEND